MTAMSQPPDQQQHDRDWFLRLVNEAADGASNAPIWTASELEPMWAHQLEASVVKCIEELSLVEALHCQALCESAAPPIISLRDLFSREKPDLAVLTKVGRWMERALGDPEELLPRDIALSLFNITIVLARLRCDSKLIGGSDKELARRADWVATRPWIDRASAEAMRRATTELGGIDSQEASE
jgi:hypothetical protein